MLETFIITLREGIEAFLIVAVTISYLAKTGRSDLFTPVFYGIGAGVLASIGLAHVIENYVTNEEVAEGVLALVAGALVLTLTVHMMKVGKHMKKKITDKLDKSAQKTGFAAVAGVFSFIVLMISREGFEITLLMKSISYQTEATQMIIGAMLGVVASIGVGIVWVKYSHLINLGRFLQVTAIFLVLFSIHLFAYGFHEITEAFVLPFSYETNLALHEATEFMDHDQIVGKLIGYSILVVPIAWLGVVVVRDKINSLETAK